MSHEGFDPEEGSPRPPADLSDIEAIQDLDVARLALRWALERVNKLQEERAEVERTKARLEQEHAARRAELEREQAEIKTELSTDSKRRVRILEERIATLRMEQAAMAEELALWREKALGQLPAMRSAAGAQTERYEARRLAWEAEKAALTAELEGLRRAPGQAQAPAPAAAPSEPEPAGWRERALRLTIDNLRGELGRRLARATELEAALDAARRREEDIRGRAEAEEGERGRLRADELERSASRRREELEQRSRLEARLGAAEEQQARAAVEAASARRLLEDARARWEAERAGMEAELRAALERAGEGAALRVRAQKHEARIAELEGELAELRLRMGPTRDEFSALKAEAEGLRGLLREQARAIAGLEGQRAAAEEGRASAERQAAAQREARERAEAAREAAERALEGLRAEPADSERRRAEGPEAQARSAFAKGRAALEALKEQFRRELSALEGRDP